MNSLFALPKIQDCFILPFVSEVPQRNSLSYCSITCNFYSSIELRKALRNLGLISHTTLFQNLDLLWSEKDSKTHAFSICTIDLKFTQKYLKYLVEDVRRVVLRLFHIENLCGGDGGEGYITSK